MPRKWTDEYVSRRFPALVRELLKEQGKDPDIKPTHSWLNEHGLSGVRSYADRNDKTVDEVLIEDAGFTPRDGVSLPEGHPETLRYVRQWLNDVDEYDRVKDVAKCRSHIGRIMWMAETALGSVNLVKLGRKSSRAAVRDTIDLFKQMNRELESEGGRHNYASTLVKFLDYLKIINVIDDHPVREVLDRMGWSYNRENKAVHLTPNQVAQCWNAAETPEQHALVICMAFAGVRPSDVSLMYETNISLDSEDPRIEFGEDRKNGPGTAAILAGHEVLSEYLDYLDVKWDDWNGALFPSDLSADGTRSYGWVADQIAEIVTRADVTLEDGSQPTPKHFRRFWFSAYATAVSHHLDRKEEVAVSAGDDPETVVSHYLPERQRRDHFRQYAKNYFQSAVPEEVFTPPEDIFAAREDDDGDPQIELRNFSESGAADD